MTTGEQLRNQGIARATANTNPLWKKAAESVMDTLIKRGKPFSANDFNQMMESMWPSIARTARPAAIGALFSRYSHSRRIVRVGVTRAERPTSHARLYPTWISADVVADLNDPTVALGILGEVLSRLNEAIESVASAPATVYAPGHDDGLKHARRILNEEINRKR